VHIIRYHTSESPAPLVGVRDEGVGVRDEGQVYGLPGVGSLADLWALPLAEIRQRVAERERVPAGDLTLLPPVDGRTEVWAAGVTYFSSREARVEESERSADVYRQVYDAERPELFFKSAAWRVAGDGQTIAVRADSAVDVPEPEVAVVINRFGEIAGYTACNDVSSRSIEGENPLYLPQAKIYLGGCALGPAIRPAWEVADPYDLGIELTIRRDGAVAWQGRASTSALRRRFDDLAGYLMRADIHPDGVVLSTGTCLVPPAPFSLADGDVVTVTVDQVGALTTGVCAAWTGCARLSSGRRDIDLPKNLENYAAIQRVLWGDTRAAVPRYRQIYAEVRARLESGEAAAQSLDAARPDPLR